MSSYLYGITDIQFALEILTQEKEKQVETFKKYINEKKQDKCLDLTEVKKKITRVYNK